jgi:hypothetical protein
MYTGLKLTTNGLVFGYDTGYGPTINNTIHTRLNRGRPATNLLTGIGNSYGTQDGQFFKTNYGNETSYVPTLGERTTRYVNIFNDINGSGACCLSLFAFGDISVSPSTVYTYQIIYRTINGYSHPNYMYQYQFNGGTYVTEFGLLDGSRTENLGDGWVHGWGTFTTNASTNRLITYLFHYEYSFFNKVEIAAISITQGNTILRPNQIPSVGQTRSVTQSLTDAVKKSTIDVSNMTFDTNGRMLFDGVSNRVSVANNSSVNISGDITLELVLKTNGSQGVAIHKETQYTLLIRSNGAVTYADSSIWSYASFGDHGSAITTGPYHHIVVTKSGSTVSIYVNNNLIVSRGFGSSITQTNNILYVGSYDGSGAFFNGEIPVSRIYNRAISTTEIALNYGTYKSRFNLP